MSRWLTEAEIGPFAPSNAPKHQQSIQKILDAAGDGPVLFRFLPGDYHLPDPAGLRVPPHATLVMTGARFHLAREMAEDGQVFLLDGVSDVAFQDGEIFGQRDNWDPGVNIAGIRMRGAVSDIRVHGMRFRDLSSNAIGIFASSKDDPARDIIIRGIRADNCCNYYGDYLQPDSGPAPGSQREDQGSIAMYYVDGWLVESCQLGGSQSDGTHFCHCRNGLFVNNVVADSRMGGYFLEDCEHVVGSGNLIRGNGSRGVTIERDSAHCILQNNIITYSGREGLWAPDVENILVTGNVFRMNGRKDDRARDCEIRLDDTEQYATQTRAIRISGNTIHVESHQTAAIYISDGVQADIEGNTIIGPAPAVYKADNGG